MLVREFIEQLEAIEIDQGADIYFKDANTGTWLDEPCIKVENGVVVIF